MMKWSDISISARIFITNLSFAGLVVAALLYLFFSIEDNSAIGKEQTTLVSNQMDAIGRQEKLLIQQHERLQQLQLATELSENFYQIRYWLTDLAVSWLNDSETNAENARQRLNENIDVLASVEEQLSIELNTAVGNFYDKMIEAVDVHVDGNRVLGNSLMAEGRRGGEEIDEKIARYRDRVRTAR